MIFHKRLWLEITLTWNSFPFLYFMPLFLYFALFIYFPLFYTLLCASTAKNNNKKKVLHAAFLCFRQQVAVWINRYLSGVRDSKTKFSHHVPSPKLFYQAHLGYPDFIDLQLFSCTLSSTSTCTETCLVKISHLKDKNLRCNILYQSINEYISLLF